MNKKQLSLLGLARRAGRLALGCEAATEAIRNGRARLVILAEDLSPRTAGGISREAEEEGIEVLTAAACMDELGMALGKRTGVIAVNDAGFAGKIAALQQEAPAGQREIGGI